MREFAVKVLLTLSALLGIQNHPADTQGWTIKSDWVKTKEGYVLFIAENKQINCQCQENPAAYIEFPTTIHSSSQVLLGNQIIATTSSPDFRHTKGFYGSLVVPCYQILRSDKPITWRVLSYTEYFAWFKYFPKVVRAYPKRNFFGETLHIGAALILLILCVLYLIIFTRKISSNELTVLVLSNAFTAIYFMGSVSGMMGLDIPMLAAHKIADTGLWLGFLFFIHFLYMEGIVPCWMNRTYKLLVTIGVAIILTGQTGDTIQLGTTVPFLFTAIFIFYGLFKLIAKNSLRQRKNVFQFLALFSFLIGYCNDVLIVTGFSDRVPIFPIGIMGSYVFILLSVNERITQTYTERDELKVLTAKLKQANEDIQKAQDELVKSEKMAALGRAVARIAHELNTPICITRGAAQNIEAETNRVLTQLEKESNQNLRASVAQYSKDLKKMSAILMSGISRAAELVRNFKEVSNDQTNVQQRAFELYRYIQTTLSTLEAPLKRKNITINLRGDEVTLHSDPGLYYQIIENLTTNVQKYAYDDEGGSINITLKNFQDELILLFEDYGKGIPKEHLPKIFDAFFTTGGGKGGTGLGLNIVYRIVTVQLKGKIKCDSTEGAGTLFTLVIPK